METSVDRNSLYKHRYWYESGLNQSMVSSLRDVVNSAVEMVELLPSDSALDIGCNDGTMLTMYPSDVIKIGVDPSEVFDPPCDIYINDFIENADLSGINAKIVTAIAMFYDLDTPRVMLKKVVGCLDRNGVFIVQMTDLAGMLTVNAWDNIVHEHVAYYSLRVLVNLFKQNGLDIFDVQYNNVNGASIRVFACHRGARPISGFVHESLEIESSVLGALLPTLSSKINNIIWKVRTFINGAAASGMTVDVLGASTKGNTLLQTCQIDSRVIRQAAEVNWRKVGLYTVGSNIPIVHQDQSLDDPPDIYLILPWHFIEFFKVKLADYLEDGGAFLVPMPEPRLITKKGEELL